LVVIPTNHREIPGSTPGRYNLQIEITSKNTVKWNSERRIPGKSSENQRLFTGPGANLVV